MSHAARRIAVSLFVTPILVIAALGFSACDSSKKASQKTTTDTAGKPDKYTHIIDEATTALIRGDGKAFRAVLSPGTIKREQRGDRAVDDVIYERFIPFFSGFRYFSQNVQTISTRDIDGHEGLAIARSFFTADGKEHFFVIYVLEEGDKLTIGNILIDTTMADIEKGR
jgi:hypothetical protein